MNHIELFAGCGGLSLGMEKAGFELVLANELSPMAAESFAFNFLDENLEELAVKGQGHKRTFWLKSQYPDLKSRLRENPFEFPAFDSESGSSDLPEDFSELEGNLVVGSIVELNRLLAESPDLVGQLRSAFGRDGGLDLVSGGPPCQSFSMAGLRRRDCEKNTLPWEFATFVKHTQPKVAMLENVTGILRAFKGDDGKSYHAWYEVAKVFASINYVPLCLHVNARLAGVAQNRPRFIMIAVRYDHLSDIMGKLDEASQKLFEQPLDFYEEVKIEGEALGLGKLQYLDAMKDRSKFENTFLKPLVSSQEVSVKDALDDLKQKQALEPSVFVRELNATFDMLPKREELLNHDYRNNGDLVKRRFRIYQVLQQIEQKSGDKSVTKAVFSKLKGLDERYLAEAVIFAEAGFGKKEKELRSLISTRLKSLPASFNTQNLTENIVLELNTLGIQFEREIVLGAISAYLNGLSKPFEQGIWDKVKDYEFLLDSGELASFRSNQEFVNYLLAHPTKKQTQKALVANSPAPAALSIPDDACHYDEKELRVLTVREMARIQSFPDNFVFRSKVTTGGKMRKFEVPQYTQVGNAVPPLLGLALGQSVKALLDVYNE